MAAAGTAGWAMNQSKTSPQVVRSLSAGVRAPAFRRQIAALLRSHDKNPATPDETYKAEPCAGG
jgi:hypothetical protein